MNQKHYEKQACRIAIFQNNANYKSSPATMGLALLISSH